MAGETLRVEVKHAHPGFTLDVAFDAPPGFTVLFGPSGAGKSTTLGAIAGLVRPDAGTITLGQDVWLDRARGVEVPAWRRGIAYVFQGLALFPHLSAQHNVEYGIDREVPRAERRARATAMLERMKVGHLARRRPASFSGGEAQRVALARAFARAPRVVLLDEPFSAMDRDLARDLCADARRVVAELGVPGLLVTHHRNKARLLGDRAVLIERGRVVGAGSLDELLEPREDR